MKYRIITILMLTLISCSENESKLIDSPDLNGKWVDVETRMDTLSFDFLDNTEIMNLNRAKEMRDGELLPKYGSGPYEYKLTEGEIALYWKLSSNSAFHDYYFKIIDDELHIGNFYGSESGETLIFEKINE